MISEGFVEVKDFINNNNISIVPTMGNLHDGHLELIKSAKSSNAYVVATIFINPLQFNDKNDYKNYPITIEEDLKAPYYFHQFS